MTKCIHLVARARRYNVALTHHEVATWLWERMREAFPDALSASIMPNHAHLLAPSDDADESRLQLSAILSGLRRSKHLGACIEWEPVVTEGLIDEPPKIERSVRYLDLNPARAGLVRDPLSWPWSTHRDVMGAIADPWVTAERLADALRRPLSNFREEHHRYVSSDPSVRVDGTPCPPVGEVLSGIAYVPLADVLASACAATRAQPEDIRRRSRARRLFIQLAWQQGWRNDRELARLCGIAPRTVRWYLEVQDEDGLRAALVCLSDRRLRAYLDEAIHRFLARTLQQKAG